MREGEGAHNLRTKAVLATRIGANAQNSPNIKTNHGESAQKSIISVEYNLQIAKATEM